MSLESRKAALEAQRLLTAYQASDEAAVAACVDALRKVGVHQASAFSTRTYDLAQLTRALDACDALADVAVFVEEREQARKKRDYERADSIRAELEGAFGVAVDDGTRQWWASARVLELDANVPGWWSFPHEKDADGRFAVPAESFSFRDDRWTGCVRESLRPPRDAPPPQKLSIAPMMEYTTPHFRHLVRLLTANTWLYTEMEVDQTLRHTDHPRLDRFLDFPVAGHPTALQLGGCLLYTSPSPRD